MLAVGAKTLRKETVTGHSRGHISSHIGLTVETKRKTPTAGFSFLNADSGDDLEIKTENEKMRKETVARRLLVTSQVTSPLTILTTLTETLTR